MTAPALISIVDDDDSVRESLGGLMRSVGFRVVAFSSAEEFLGSTHASVPDCLILDIRMPGMNGRELQRHLRADGSTIPVIFITAHETDEGGRRGALREGAVDYLIKPFSEEALLKAVQAALGGER